MVYKESELRNMSLPISTTEHEKCKHAIEMVKDALVDGGYILNKSLSNYSSEKESYAYYFELRDKNYSTVTILLQGSYANNTNVRTYSDVDISIVCKPILPIDFNFYKTSILKALVNKFGINEVNRKNKSINIKGNTYRKSIDVVPAFQIDSKDIKNGIYFYTDKGIRINNYPSKQIDNENRKNADTKYNFKKYVRIFKSLRYTMENCNYAYASKIGSFQVESLLWNLPDECFTEYTYYLGFGVQAIIRYLLDHKYYVGNYYESNGVKVLCPTDIDSSNIRGFIDELNRFFQYDKEN